MSSIWIILLDTSGSMGGGFTSKQGHTPDPLAEHGAWATKLDAAKELLLKQVATIRVQDLAVFQFTDEYSKIFQGTRDQLLAQSHLIRKLDAGGNTSIANAIGGVEVDPSFEKYRSVNVLVISDGLSDLDAAAKAAESLLIKYPFARIDTILIDDTDDGRKVAESVSINGTVRPVTSSIQLGSALSGARLDALRSNLTNMALVRLQTQQELAAFEQIPEPTLISVTSGQRLTSETLRSDIVPTLAGIEALGYAANYITRGEYRGSVSSISQDSPISINLTGLKEAVELALTYVIPWRRKNAERIAMLEIEKRELELASERQKLSMSNNYDAEQRRLELLRMQLELANSKLNLAERMLKAIDPESQLCGEARERALGRLLSGVDNLSATRLEFEILGDTPRQ
jgi:hypothetical protein